MKIFVTGGAGYIGSAVVKELVLAGDSAIVFDDLSQGHRAAVHPEAIFVKGSLDDRNLLDQTLAKFRPDAIMHFASRTLVGESMADPFLYLRDNVANTLNLLEAAVEHGVRRFILSSTANLFDSPEEIPITEDAQIRPGSPYGESKYILERTLAWMDRLYGMRYATLRYFNACGASSQDLGEAHDPETHLIPLVLQVALGQREKITIYGDDYDTPDGTCVRDYVHVVDLAQAHILALRNLNRGSRTYNLGNGTGFSVTQVIDTARRVTGHPIPAEIGARRAGDPPVLIAGSARIREELGWNPRFPSLQDIVQSAWEWHRTHPTGFSDRQGEHGALFPEAAGKKSI